MIKCVNLMGIFFGIDNLLVFSKWINLKGYFENKDVINIYKLFGSCIWYWLVFKDYYDSLKIKKDWVVLIMYL